MGYFELFATAVSLSMDAFAVSMCKGLSLEKATFRKALTVGLYFGVFQALMPLAGYLLGSRFEGYISAFDHWIAFGLLCFIGGKMLWESFPPKGWEEEACAEVSLSPGVMLPQAVATSIDALAMGISFALLGVRIVPAVGMIGLTTLVICMAGVAIGHFFGARFKSVAERVGGVVLVLLGIKILLQHTVFAAPITG